MSYPQLYVSNPWFSWLTPPPLGRVLVLLVYWAVIIYMMTSNAIVKDAYFWERIGFRNAWVTVTQVPLLYLLASKSNVLAFIAGTSYERLNWLHRWVARTMFVTASVHGWHFWTEWVRADFLEVQLQMMPMVKYGLGAWAVLLWSLVVGFAPLRRLSYELFVAQHIVSAVIFLWLLYQHVPSYAQYNIWFAIAALCFDRAVRLVLLVWQNVRFRPNKSPCIGGKRIGHAAQLRTVGDSTTVVTVKDVHFSWRAGQHLYLSLPQVGPLEAHPYTIACPHQLPDTCICNSIQLVVRKHNGFSKRLYDFAKKREQQPSQDTVTAFVSGPYGVPPRWDTFETLILISASTGASFTLPILENALQSRTRKACTKRIDFLLAARQGEEIGFYTERLEEAVEQAHELGIELRVHIAVTRGGDDSSFGGRSVSEGVEGPQGQKSSESGEDSEDMVVQVNSAEAERSRADAPKKTPTTSDIEKGSATSVSSSPAPRRRTAAMSGCCCNPSEPNTSSEVRIHRMTSRPDIEHFIREPVEASGGEASVVVCGGKSLVARVRNCVAKLSDERAVHKGTGAQGIGLFVEEYCF